MGAALPFLPEYQGLFCVIARRNRAKVLLNPFIEVKAHGFCISNPETTHLVTLAGNPVLTGDSAKRVKQILVGDRNNTFLFTSRLGELESLRFVALAGTDRKYPRFRIQQTQNKGGIAQVLKHLLGESHAKRAAASRLSEKAISPFSPSLRLWKPWKTASGLRTVPTACAYLFFLSGFLPIQRKCSFLFRGRTVAVMGRGRRVNMTKKSKQHTGGFILKKSPEA